MPYSYYFEVEGLQINSFNHIINWLCDLLATGPIISRSRSEIQLATVTSSTSKSGGKSYLQCQLIYVQFWGLATNVLLV